MWILQFFCFFGNSLEVIVEVYTANYLFQLILITLSQSHLCNQITLEFAWNYHQIIPINYIKQRHKDEFPWNYHQIIWFCNSPLSKSLNRMNDQK